jgi:predicted O-methyltransferase YrrM
MSLGMATRRTLKRASIRLFMGADKLGAHILPKHYYTSIPDYKWLNENKSVWCRRVDMTGVEWDLQSQLAWLERQCQPFYDEVRGLGVYADVTDGAYGLGFGPIESQVLHCVCRAAKPRRIVEVGGGVSTACMLYALRKNSSEGSPACEVSCVEPFPALALSGLDGIELVQSMVQTLPLSFFDRLQAGDILFIDSSHSVKTGSEVPYLYLEVLPRLKPGVLVHIHDIFLPYLYQRDVLKDYFDWQETALLAALLKGNSSLRVLCCLSALHYDASTQLRTTLADYRPQPNAAEGLTDLPTSGHFPASIWLRSAMPGDI